MFRRLNVLALLLCFIATALAAPAPQGPSRAVVSQTPGATLNGSVVDASLNPLAGVVVTLERDGRVVAKATSGTDGLFSFANVAPGPYRVRAEKAGFPTLAREVRVPANSSAVQLPLVLSRPQDAMPDAKMSENAATTAQRAQTVGQGTPVAAPPPPPMSAVGAGGGRGGGVMAEMPIPAQPPPGRRAETQADAWSGYRYPHSGERYAHVEPNRFQSAYKNPLSTFGADVDTASYTNVRRFLSQGQLPPRDAVRVEEFVNYFRFDYDLPRDGRPLAMTAEVADCPWAPAHRLVLIGARARASRPREIEGRNLVLLLDVSGSMAPQERLPLIKAALGMFVDTLRPDDRLAIVTYAGTSGVALPSTPMRQREVIRRAIDSLNAGGSTNGASGLLMAYRVAREAFVPGGVNRVILATDGDFNVGVTSHGDLLRLIGRERESGVFLSVLGVGSGNLKDATMEMLADRGNGHYAYLDSLQEARRVLLREADGTIETVAKDVKFQVEFNPALVSAWKLIGYENRLMAAEDFNDDRKDGGEMGAGHTVTVLYEVVPVGVDSRDVESGARASVDPLKYQPAPERPPQPRPAAAASTAGEWLTVKARYKAPEGDRSDLITMPVRSGRSLRHLPFAAAVAEFGLLLRTSNYDEASWDRLLRRAEQVEPPPSVSAASGESFRELVAIARSLSQKRGRDSFSSEILRKSPQK
jgi:Ca-activated chloride channel family protein